MVRCQLRRLALRCALGGLIVALLVACGGAPATTPESGATAPAAGGAAGGAAQYGGAMTVAYQNDIATLDPAIGYDWNNWPVITLPAKAGSFLGARGTQHAVTLQQQLLVQRMWQPTTLAHEGPIRAVEKLSQRCCLPVASGTTA